MKYYLGIDTSNYTTSAAICGEDGEVEVNSKRLLPVPRGGRGLRQSDAVFEHTRSISDIVAKIGKRDIAAVGYSAYPRDAIGSYMPCFLVGKAIAQSVASLLAVPCAAFSHQRGHIRAALYSCKREDLIGGEYLAFHVSGGTTELLHVKSGNIALVGETLDISAGQAIDRVGVMLGLDFPCGAALEKLAENAKDVPKTKVCVADGKSNLSGIENQAAKMHRDGKLPEDIAAYTLNFVRDTIIKTVTQTLEKTGELPVIFAGGVMSNKLIREAISKSCDAYFAEPQYSADNACGTALLTFDKYGK